MDRGVPGSRAYELGKCHAATSYKIAAADRDYIGGTVMTRAPRSSLVS
jgi:hypothetical protein